MTYVLDIFSSSLHIFFSKKKNYGENVSLIYSIKQELDVACHTELFLLYIVNENRAVKLIVNDTLLTYRIACKLVISFLYFKLVINAIAAGS